MNHFKLVYSFVYIVQFILFLLLLNEYAIGSEESHKNQINIKNLIKMNSFPNEEADSVFIAYPSFMDMDLKNNIYICDHMNNSILKFTNNGNYIGRIGRKGEGPSEFIHPYIMCHRGGLLYVSDVRNSRIQILDDTGNYISSFKVINMPYALDYFNHEIYTLILSNNIKKRNLITVFNPNGKVVRRFGKFIFDTPAIVPSINHGFIKILKDKFYFVFKFFPVIRIYNIDGKLKKEFKFDNKEYRKKAKKNYNKNDFKIGKMTYYFNCLFKAVDINDDGIFLALYDEDIIIDQYDFNFKFIARYQRRHIDKPFYLFDFCAKKEKTGYVYYILNSEGVGEIPVLDVYRIE